MRRLWVWACLAALGCDGGAGEPSANGGAADAAPDGGGLDPAGDPDGDGRTTAEELAGYTVVVDPAGFGPARAGFLERRTVTSDPLQADTDGDGLDDAAEYRFRSDPTRRDTDTDGLSDGDEVHRWQTSPVSADTDGDSRGPDPDDPLPPAGDLFDGAELALDAAGEPGPQATSPTLADTDGDGVSDLVERRRAARTPAVAELPRLAVEVVDQVQARLQVEYAEAEVGRQSYGVSQSAQASQQRARTEGHSDTESTRLATTITASTTVGLSLSGVGFSYDVEVEASYTQGFTDTDSVQVDQGWAQGAGQAHAEATATARNRTVTSAQGSVALGVRLSNPGFAAYTVDGLGLTLRQALPAEGRYRAIGVLTPPPGVDAVTLAPGEATPVLRFANDALDPDVVRAFLEAPSTLHLEPAGFELRGPDGGNLLFLSEATYARTALVVVDFGDGRVVEARVAAAVDRGPDGALRGVAVGRALAALGLAFDTAPDADGRAVLAGVDGVANARHPQPAPALDDPEWPADAPPQGPRGVAGVWAVLTAGREAPVDRSGDFATWRLQPGDQLRLVYQRDADQDGLWDREEAAWGSRDDTPHSDGSEAAPAGDGLSDAFEIRAGWAVAVVGAEPYPARPSPVLADSDGDGWHDGEEHSAGTDPRLPDTDGDGLNDPDDPAPLDPMPAEAP